MVTKTGKKELQYVPENGYDMFYQDVIENEFFKRVILAISDTNITKKKMMATSLATPASSAAHLT